MLDFFLLAKIVLAGALVSAAVIWVATRASPGTWRSAACWPWAIGAGVIAASGAAGVWPQWPPLEDRARFVTLVVPLAVAVETLAAGLRTRELAWLLRACLAVAVAPILLYDTVYLVDWNGPGSAEWSTAEATVIFVGLAALVSALWFALIRLQVRTSARVVASVLLIDALAAAIVVMLSGYLGAGVIGLGLAAALAGASLALLIAEANSSSGGGLGVAVMGVFSVVLMGRFFGSLSTGLAACLLLAPLLAWIVELRHLRQLAPRWRTAGRLACVAVPLVVVVVVAQRQFAAKSSARTGPPASGEIQSGQ
jgi:hypothetical protein